MRTCKYVLATGGDHYKLYGLEGALIGEVDREDLAPHIEDLEFTGFVTNAGAESLFDSPEEAERCAKRKRLKDGDFKVFRVEFYGPRIPGGLGCGDHEEGELVVWEGPVPVIESNVRGVVVGILYGGLARPVCSVGVYDGEQFVNVYPSTWPAELVVRAIAHGLRYANNNN